MLFGYFYYSKQCDFCYNLMKLMENHGIFQHFKCECVDDIDITELTKRQISSVPTLVLISNNNGKQQVMMHEKDQAFNWIKQFLQARRQSAIKDAEAGRKLIQSDNTKSLLKDGLFEYCPDEHNGISDSYAIFREDVDMALPKTFVQYDQKNLMAEERIMTVPVGDMKTYKQKESIGALYGNDTKKLISQMEDMRKRQDSDFKSVMEQKTVAAVVNNVGRQ